jgi:hypothetical protein
MAAFPWRWPAVAVLGVLTLAAANPVRTSAGRPESRDAIAKQLALSRGGRLSLDNSYGDITIQSWNRDAVDLRAERIADSAADLGLAAIDIRTLPDSLTVTSRVPPYAPDARVRVDYRLRVPADVDLKLVRTDRGRVVITDVTGRAIVRIINGTVRVRGFGGVLDASTLNGEIDAAVARLGRGDSITLDTYNGDILLRVPAGLKAHYELRTLNGTIDTNVPLPVLNSYGPHVVHESSGVEDPLVRLTSINGTIRVTR